MHIKAMKTSLFLEKEDMNIFLVKHLPQLKDGDILVITSKILALAQGRVGLLKDREKLIKKDSKKIIKTPWAYLTLTSDGWCINAGVDDSNARGNIILLPKGTHGAARAILKEMKKKMHIKNLGILITDTKSQPLRVGTVGQAIACAGFEPLKSYIGKKDLFGRKSRLTQSNIADALAASAVLVMGEGNEQRPLAVISDAPVVFTSKDNVKKLSLPPKKDIYSKVYRQ